MKVIELALNAARKRQSSITRFVHCCYENSKKDSETIPIYENFCFALALLRTKVMENILEAKWLLERVIQFERDGLFPIYLHDYPRVCQKASSRLYPPIFYILQDFYSILGSGVRVLLEKVLSSLVFIEPQEKKSLHDIINFLLYAQMHGRDPFLAFQKWDPVALVFSGPQKQEGGEPELTLYDLFMGQWGGKFSARALQDHRSHLQASLIYPAEKPFAFRENFSIEAVFWGNGNPTHSLMLETKGKIDGYNIFLEEKEVYNEMEIIYYCNIHFDTQIFINGIKATSFQIKDQIQIVSSEKTVIFSFELLEGDGVFCGRIYQGNRPHQVIHSEDLKFHAYDWVIALRTVQRKQACCFRVVFSDSGLIGNSIENS
jgi:hypothetical protein